MYVSRKLMIRLFRDIKMVVVVVVSLVCEKKKRRENNEKKNEMFILDVMIKIKCEVREKECVW